MKFGMPSSEHPTRGTPLKVKLPLVCQQNLNAMPDTIGEFVLHEKLQRDLILSFLNPASLDELQAIMAIFACSKTVLSEEDLVEVVWKKQNKFREQDFVLRNTVDMSVEDMQERVALAQPSIFENEPLWGLQTPVWLLRTKEEILEEYRALVYVPVDVYQVVRGGQEVRSLFRPGQEERRRRLLDGLDEAESLFEMACEAGLDTGIIKRLLEEAQHLHPGHKFVEITDAVILAAAGGHLEVLQCLIGLSTQSVIHQGDEEGLTPLLAAAERGQRHIVRYLIGQGVDTSAADVEGGLFLKACTSSDIDFVRELISNDFGNVDVDINATDQAGHTAVHYAAEMGDVEMVKFLVNELHVPFAREPGSENDVTWGPTASLLQSAALGGSIIMVDFLVENLKLDPHSLDDAGANLIFDASGMGWDHLVDHLVSKYSLDPAAVDDDECTALFDAASEGHWHTIRNLVDNHGVDVHHRNAFGQTILFVAATAGDDMLYDVLIERYGMHTDVVDADGNLAEDYFPPDSDGWETDSAGESGTSSWETDSGVE